MTREEVYVSSQQEKRKFTKQIFTSFSIFLTCLSIQIKRLKMMGSWSGNQNFSFSASFPVTGDFTICLFFVWCLFVRKKTIFNVPVNLVSCVMWPWHFSLFRSFSINSIHYSDFPRFSWQHFPFSSHHIFLWNVKTITSTCLKQNWNTTMRPWGNLNVECEKYWNHSQHVLFLLFFAQILLLFLFQENLFIQHKHRTSNFNTLALLCSLHSNSRIIVEEQIDQRWLLWKLKFDFQQKRN